MCGRYVITYETAHDIRGLARFYNPSINWGRHGDIHPSEMATIITGKQKDLTAEDMRWGFPSYQSKQLMINARAETALEKKSFSESVLSRRCIIPAAAFYEWDRSKAKVTFHWDGNRTMYMAGFYRLFDIGERFIILTTGANASMRAVHDRMPLILPQDEVKDWIYNDDMIRDYLKKEAPILTGERAYEQLSLFDL